MKIILNVNGTERTVEHADPIFAVSDAHRALGEMVTEAIDTASAPPAPAEIREPAAEKAGRALPISSPTGRRA